MPDLDRTTLLKARLSKAAETIREHAQDLRAGQDIEFTQSAFHQFAQLFNEAADALPTPAPSEAPAEAFTAEEIDEEANLMRSFGLTGSGVNRLKAMDRPQGDRVFAMLTDYARLVRERHTGKGQ